MLGCRIGHGDIYVFLENDEYLRLEHQKINGVFVNLNNPDMPGKLSLVKNEELCRLEKQLMLVKLQAEGYHNVNSLDIAIRDDYYNKLLVIGRCGPHDGYRHVNLLRYDKAVFTEQQMYAQLRHFKEKYLLEERL